MKRVKSSNLSFNLDTVVDKARRDSSMTRNSVIKYLEQGVDSAMGTASSNDTPHEQEEDQTRMESLKRQLELFLLPEESAFSSVMPPQQEKDHWDKVHHRKKWFIHPYGAFRLRWDMIIIVIMAISVVVIPMEAAYFESDDSETVEWIVFNVISDIFFMVDIAFNFRTGIVVREEYDRVVMDPWIIAKDYLGHWFIVDIISGFPFDYALALVTMFMEYSDGEGKTNSFAKATRLLQLSKFLKLCKLLRLSKLIRYLSSFEENYNSSWWEQYSWSMYNAMSQMVSCGYGRTAAENTTEAWLTCLGMASGTIGYALLLGLCANMIQTMDHTRRLHREKA
ncbi:potassium/sodium hyperpolarization-activated cyclic nucleotide-gated channel 4-like [Ixodes scapularis]